MRNALSWRTSVVRSRTLRRQLNGVLWRFRTGSPWRDLPAEYGPWSTRNKTYQQAINHSLALGQNGYTGWWEVPNKVRPRGSERFFVTSTSPISQ
ncbi:transposase [Microbispora sp. NPDC046933]|uniref:transposase n=1 Tax=Microbispora sp. NPDC046933 TaxID=3155618 RepID=UPI0033CA8833